MNWNADFIGKKTRNVLKVAVGEILKLGERSTDEAAKFLAGYAQILCKKDGRTFTSTRT